MPAGIRRVIEVILMLAGLLALPFAWMQYRDDGMKSAAEPPWSIRTLDDFRKWRPQYDQAVKLETEGLVYYLIFGERARMLASGPSGYMFDVRGNFIGWIRDTGDDSYLRIAIDGSVRKGALGAAQIVVSPPRAAAGG